MTSTSKQRKSESSVTTGISCSEQIEASIASGTKLPVGLNLVRTSASDSNVLSFVVGTHDGFAASQSQTKLQACKIVKGRAKTRGCVTTLRKAPIESHGIATGVAPFNADSSQTLTWRCDGALSSTALINTFESISKLALAYRSSDSKTSPMLVMSILAPRFLVRCLKGLSVLARLAGSALPTRAFTASLSPRPSSCCNFLTAMATSGVRVTKVLIPKGYIAK